MRIITSLGTILSTAIVTSMVLISVEAKQTQYDQPIGDEIKYTIPDTITSTAMINMPLDFPIIPTVTITMPTVPQIKIDVKQKKCLALNIYFESRGESKLGQTAVAWVTLNRTHSTDYPKTICDVVWEKDQFSWTNDGKSDKPKDKVAWIEAMNIAESVMLNYNKYEDPTDGSIMFHSTKVDPKWNQDYSRTSRIDNHIFYKDEPNG